MLKRFIVACSIAFASLPTQAQSLYPDLDGILSCSTQYMNNNFSQIQRSRDYQVVPGERLGACELFSSKPQDYVLLTKNVADGQKPAMIKGYLLTRFSLNDNQIATLRALAETSVGYFPAYLDANYNLNTYFVQLEVSQGLQKNIVMQRTMPMPVAQQFVKNPDRTLVLEINVVK